MYIGFKDVFVEKLRKQREAIKNELERPSSERRKDWLKRQLKETKSLKKIVEQFDDGTQKCPHCGKKL